MEYVHKNRKLLNINVNDFIKESLKNNIMVSLRTIRMKKFIQI